MPITCRNLREISDYKEAVRLQQKVWGFSGDHAIPWSQMHVIARNGGVVIGAFDEGALIGFLYSNPGWDGRSAFLYSKMLGVLPEYAGRGVGRMLKRRQRREALGLGYDRIVWTFDPLERAAALLNLGYLGVIARRYLVNYYGTGGLGELHAGLGTDRLLVEWWIRGTRPDRRARRRVIPLSTQLPDGVVLLEHDERGDAPVANRRAVTLPALVAIPSDIQLLKRRDITTAGHWQSAIRRALGRALRAGGEVSDVVRHRVGDDLSDYFLVTAGSGSSRGRRRSS